MSWTISSLIVFVSILENQSIALQLLTLFKSSTLKGRIHLCTFLTEQKIHYDFIDDSFIDFWTWYISSFFAKILAFLMIYHCSKTNKP